MTTVLSTTQVTNTEGNNGITKHLSNVSYAAIFFTVLIACSDKKELINYNLDGTVKETWTFEKDTLTGTKTTYWPNGKAKVVYNYKDGKLNGEYIGYYENGYIARKSFFYDNLLRGPAYRYYPDIDGSVESETYFLDVNGRQYAYYQKQFNHSGELEKEDRTLSIDFSCDNKQLIAEFNFLGSFPYDSVYLITGQFQSNYSTLGNVHLDTIKISQLPLKLLCDENMIVDGVFRGKCIFFMGTNMEDSTRLDVKIRFFEEMVSETCYQ